MAFALNGRPTDQWVQHLSLHGISQWHSRSSVQALNYLDFPIHFSLAQRDHFINGLIHRVAQSCHIHKQRQLFIRGRTTVPHALVYSTLWHVLRLCPMTKKQINTIQSIGYQFITYRMFPKLKRDTLLLPRSKGGLGLLDIETQQKVFQWRWLQPLFEQAPIEFGCPHHHFLLIQYMVGFYNPDSTSILGPILFPELRSSTFRSSLHPLSLLLKAIDRLPKDLTHLVINSSTCLQLPLPYIWIPSSTTQSPNEIFPRKPGMKKLITHQLYQLDPTERYLVRFSTQDIQAPPRKSPGLIKLFYRHLDSNKILMNLFFVRQCLAPIDMSPDTPNSIPTRIDFIPIASQMIHPIPQAMIKFPRSKNKIVRQFMQPPSRTDSNPSPCTPSENYPNSVQWDKFWTTSIHATARNIWYRIIHNKSPVISLLHHIILGEFPSPYCAYCPTVESTREHHFIACPQVWPIWEYFIIHQTQLFQPASSPTLQAIVRKSVFSLDFPTTSLTQGVGSFPQLVGAILHSTWLSYINNIFHDIPVNTETNKNQVLQFLSSLVTARDEDF